MPKIVQVFSVLFVNFNSYFWVHKRFSLFFIHPCACATL